MFEIDEDLKRDQMQNIWKSFGSYVVGISFAILLSTIAWVAWQNSEETKRQIWTGQLIVIQEEIRNNKKADAIKHLHELTTSAKGNLAMLANLWLIALEGGKADKVKDLAAYGSLARLFSGETDEASIKKFPVFATTAREIQAAKLLGKKDQNLTKEDIEKNKAEAIKLLKDAGGDMYASPALRERVVILLSTLDAKEKSLIPPTTNLSK